MGLQRAALIFPPFNWGNMETKNPDVYLTRNVKTMMIQKTVFLENNKNSELNIDVAVDVGVDEKVVDDEEKGGTVDEEVVAGIEDGMAVDEEGIAVEEVRAAVDPALIQLSLQRS